MKIYLAGPMRGAHLFNFPAFFRAAMDLRALGHEVFNPAENDMAGGLDPSESLESQNFDLDIAFVWDIRHVLMADAIALLPGWEKSTGSCVERSVAAMTGKKVILLSESEGGYKIFEDIRRKPTITWEDWK